MAQTAKAAGPYQDIEMARGRGPAGVPEQWEDPLLRGGCSGVGSKQSKFRSERRRAATTACTENHMAGVGPMFGEGKDLIPRRSRKGSGQRQLAQESSHPRERPVEPLPRLNGGD